MQIMGPIAAIMVRRGARETSDTASLIQWLAARIDVSSEREKFVADLTLMSFAPAAAVPDAPATAGTYDRTRLFYAMDAPAARAVSSDDIARASQWLTTHLGPIASVLVRRTAQQPGCTREQFVATLASHLPNERERERFIEAFR
jgi:eukaryotic-like serine/threonine-protein kinase